MWIPWRWLLAIALLSGCAPKDVQPSLEVDGRRYGVTQGAFRHRWWNYYERALSFAEGGFLKEAEGDLKAALSMRGEDQRRARTYGMHFVDYFPHRELGIIYYKKADYESAREQLEISLRQYPTAKARYYLDRVRRALLEASGAPVTVPRIGIAPSEEIWSREDPIVISGVVEDEGYVSSLRINGHPIYLEQSRKRVGFRHALELSQGRHDVVVEASNLLGGRAERKVVIHVDREGPVVSLEKVQRAEGPSGPALVVKGSAWDEAGIDSLELEGTPLSPAGREEFLFSERVPLKGARLTVVATDRLGNRTTAQLDLRMGGRGERPVLLAMAAETEFLLQIGGLFGRGDEHPPRIVLEGWTEKQSVYMDKVYVEGRAMDDTKVVSVTINGIPILRRPGKWVAFGHTARLAEGTNRIRVTAKDEAGHEATKVITVERRIPKALQLGERLCVTVLPFQKKGVASELVALFPEFLLDSLMQEGRFRLVEREKLDLVLEEQKLSQTVLMDRRTALKLGRLLAAHCIMAGNIIESRDGLEVVARMIDTETSEILATADAFDELKDRLALEKLAQALAVQFHREFPLVEGTVVRREGDRILTDLGYPQIKMGRRVIVYHEEIVIHPQSGKILGRDHRLLGHARVVQVMPSMSKAEILDEKGGGVRPPEKIITQ